MSEVARTATGISAHAECLVSYLLISEGDAAQDLACLNRITSHIQERFAYFEVLLLAASPGTVWLETIRRGADSIPNLRVVVFVQRQHYDELLFQGLARSIGDIVLCDNTATANSDTFDRLFEACMGQGYEIVKSVSGATQSFSPNRLLLKLIQYGLYAFLGRRIETDILKSICLNRAAASRIVESGDAFQYFRLLNLGDQFHETHILLDGNAKAAPLEGIVRKAQISAFLVSTAAARILTGIAISSLMLCLLSLSYMVYAVLVWLFLEGVSEGWTSLSLVLSVLFAANFGVMSAMSIGILQVLRTSQKAAARQSTAIEISNADLFAHANNLHVEIADDL
jgi:hypothetical protein